MPNANVTQVLIRAAKCGLIDEPWPNAAEGLKTQAALARDRFFATANHELQPVAWVFERGPEGTELTALTPESDGDGFKDAMPLIIREIAKREAFLGAVMTMEGYLTSVEVKNPAAAERKECLLQVLLDKKGMYEMWATPFHRDGMPCLPIKDGETDVMNARDNPFTGRMVPGPFESAPAPSAHRMMNRTPVRGTKTSRMDN